MVSINAAHTAPSAIGRPSGRQFSSRSSPTMMSVLIVLPGACGSIHCGGTMPDETFEGEAGKIAPETY